jgi:hypothetical protein
MYSEDKLALCFYGCGRSATHTAKNGRKYCSTRPAGCSVVQNKMKSTSVSRYGVENASSSSIVKSKRATTFRERYGVENPSFLDNVRTKISVATQDRWKQEFDKLSNLFFKSMTKREYYTVVERLTEHTYRTNIDIIDPERKRSAGWHLDHRVSKCYGYHNNIDPNVISHASNLELVPASANMSKQHKNSLNPFVLIEHATLSEPVVNRNSLTLQYTDEAGTCPYCKNVAHYKTTRDRWCCSSHQNKCPANRLKNSTGQLKFNANK